MTASRGPVPKRSEERRRTNKPTGAQPAKAQAAVGVVWSAPDEEWHEVARDWYLSLEKSGQSAFYEPSDVAAARFVATAMSTNLKQGGKMSSMMFAAVMSAMTELLTTEGARRRARIELERAPQSEEVPASVTSMDKYRKAASAKAS